jgi:hypothetical protein
MQGVVTSAAERTNEGQLWHEYITGRRQLAAKVRAGYRQGLKNFMLAHQSGKYLSRQVKIVLLAFL